VLKLSERRVCRVLGQHRSTQRKLARGRGDEEQLTADIIELAHRHGRYGYRKIAELLRSTAGWAVNDKRVERSTAALSRATRRLEGPKKAAQARPALAGGWVLHPAAGGAPEPRLVLRLRRGPHP
jgi:hypothetical protein